MLTAHSVVPAAAECERRQSTLQRTGVYCSTARTGLGQHAIGLSFVVAEHLKAQGTFAGVDAQDRLVEIVICTTGKIGPKISSCTMRSSSAGSITSEIGMRRVMESMWGYLQWHDQRLLSLGLGRHVHKAIVRWRSLLIPVQSSPLA